VNAFVFSKTDDEFTYIANLDEIDPRLAEQGLNEVHVARRESRCELCIRLSKNTVPIGTLNIEAPYAYALGKELLYCQAVARLLSEFYDVALKTSDSAWLPKISMSHIVYHRIQKVRRDHAELENILDFIESPIRKVERVADGEGEQTLANIVERVERGVFGLSATNFRKLVTCKSDKNILIRKDAASSIAIIVETLIENCRTHASVDKDSIEITITTRSGLPPGSCGTDEDLQIRIAYQARVARQQLDLLDKLTIAPVWQDEDRTYHFGLFLLGAHARLLGGVTYVDTEPLPGRKSRPVRIIVILPLASLGMRSVGKTDGE
jgi:two-component sensor histidine kinase